MQGQEEALGLSMQLSDAKQQLAQVSTALEQAREHLQAQQQALTQVGCSRSFGWRRTALHSGRAHVRSRSTAHVVIVLFCAVVLLHLSLSWPPLQHQSERQQLLQRAEAADAALERQRAATTELRRVLDALK